MRLLIKHNSHYRYPRPASLGPQLVRLRPASHAKARVETYALRIEPTSDVRWHQDPYGNHVARISFPRGARVTTFDVMIELAVDIRPVNPFDFFIDERAKNVPFDYPKELKPELVPFLDRADPSVRCGTRAGGFLESLPMSGEVVALLVEINRRVNQSIRYVIREEPGVWTPEETLENGRGSCRDMTMLLIAALRSRGLAARFASGFLVQLRDEGMIPDQPKGVDRDVVDLHAWAEVFLPGGGWIGLDATSGLLCGEGHIPLACAAAPQLAAPLDGTTDVGADDVRFDMAVGRLGHESRPTAPYTEEVWRGLLEAGDRADRALESAGLVLTLGGEPTFNSREHPNAPEWSAEALGPTKSSQGHRLMHALKDRFAPGGVILERMGKHYPGESLPRWTLDLYGRKDGAPLWSPQKAGAPADLASSRRFMDALSARLGGQSAVMEAFEDPWRFLQEEASLPIDEDPLQADLGDPEERRRLARVLDRGLGTPAGYVLPLARGANDWRTERWTFRRGHLFLVPGDSPIGLRLPLKSLSPGEPIEPLEPPLEVPDPRRQDPAAPKQEKLSSRAGEARARGTWPVRTALCVEPREGAVRVFLPPFQSEEAFLLLVGELDRARIKSGVEVVLEGYPPPSGPTLTRFSIAPDPGVLEVNLPPARTLREHARLHETVFDAALHAGLHSEKYLLDGRMAGSGGGNHLTLGGPTALESPFLLQPELLASLLTFLQHHPSLSYMFTGLFVGPTSQAPRVDEARHETLYELEIALNAAFAHAKGAPPPPPWHVDMLFRNLLVDLSGNTHRAEVSIDKLFDWRSGHGRQGLIELRAFEMPPHHRMASAQMLLMRSLVAAFARTPYRGQLVRWGQELHDRFLLPYWMWRDFESVLEFLGQNDLPLPAEGYRPFIDLRCPIAGAMNAGGVTLEVRNAIEPWHVLGEEMTSSGTSRYVDSSTERVEVRVEGLVEGRHEVLVNGWTLPLRPTGTAGEAVGGVRFRAWAPPHSLHPHIGIHHPLRFDVLDRWAQRSLGACAYHVWHPEGRAFDTPPLTRFEASARRSQRFTLEGPLPWPVQPRATRPQPETPYTLDLRRYPMDHPPPAASDDASC